jgi:hypothetical protein
MVWLAGNYRLGSTAQRLVPWLKTIIPVGSTVNDYGAGTGRAEVELIDHCSKINMVDFAAAALEYAARSLIGPKLTHTVSPLESLPEDFPVADWGMCINVLMTVDPAKLDNVMKEMRRTCHNLIIETYSRADVRLGKDLTLIKGDAVFWRREMNKYWPIVESHKSPDPRMGRVITVGREK